MMLFLDTLSDIAMQLLVMKIHVMIIISCKLKETLVVQYTEPVTFAKQQKIFSAPAERESWELFFLESRQL